jgi:lysyl-tRNA synthetase class II
MVITSENQRTVAEELSKGDFITYVGCYEDTKEDDIVEKITYLINNSKAVKEISVRVKGLVDGNGTKRVVNSIYSCTN